MKIKGIIKQICQDRTFTKRDGSQETAREIVFNAPYFKANGETSSNNFIGTHFGTFDRKHYFTYFHLLRLHYFAIFSIFHCIISHYLIGGIQYKYLPNDLKLIF